MRTGDPGDAVVHADALRARNSAELHAVGRAPPRDACGAVGALPFAASSDAERRADESLDSPIQIMRASNGEVPVLTRVRR